MKNVRLAILIATLAASTAAFAVQCGTSPVPTTPKPTPTPTPTPKPTTGAMHQAPSHAPAAVHSAKPAAAQG